MPLSTSPDSKYTAEQHNGAARISEQHSRCDQTTRALRIPCQSLIALNFTLWSLHHTQPRVVSETYRDHISSPSRPRATLPTNRFRRRSVSVGADFVVLPDAARQGRRWRRARASALACRRGSCWLGRRPAAAASDHVIVTRSPAGLSPLGGLPWTTQCHPGEPPPDGFYGSGSLR